MPRSKITYQARTTKKIAEAGGFTRYAGSGEESYLSQSRTFAERQNEPYLDAPRSYEIDGKEIEIQITRSLHGSAWKHWGIECVSDEQRERLVSGCHPVTGEKVVRASAGKAELVAVHEFVFTLPKEISLFVGRLEVPKAVEFAVSAVFDDLEKRAVGGSKNAPKLVRKIAGESVFHPAGRGEDGHKPEPGSGNGVPHAHAHGWVYAVAPLDDPHIHAVGRKSKRDPERKRKQKATDHVRLDFRAMFANSRDGPRLEALFLNCVIEQLRKHGWIFEPPRIPGPTIGLRGWKIRTPDGQSPTESEVLAASPRRRQILESRKKANSPSEVRRRSYLLGKFQARVRAWSRKVVPLAPNIRSIARYLPPHEWRQFQERERACFLKELRDAYQRYESWGAPGAARDLYLLTGHWPWETPCFDSEREQPRLLARAAFRPCFRIPVGRQKTQADPPTIDSGKPSRAAGVASAILPAGPLLDAGSGGDSAPGRMGFGIGPGERLVGADHAQRALAAPLFGAGRDSHGPATRNPQQVGRPGSSDGKADCINVRHQDPLPSSKGAVPPDSPGSSTSRGYHEVSASAHGPVRMRPTSLWDYAALDFTRVLGRPLTRNDIQKPAEDDHQRIQADPKLKPWSGSALESAAITLSLFEFAYGEDTDEIEEARLRWILKQALVRAQIWQEATRRQIAPDSFQEIRNIQQHLVSPLPDVKGSTRRDLAPPSEAEVDLLRMIGSQAVEALVDGDCLVALVPRPAALSTMARDRVVNYRPDLTPSKAKSEDESGVAYPGVEEPISPAPDPSQEEVRSIPKRKFR